MEILENQHQRARLGERLEQATPSRERLAGACGVTFRGGANKGAQLRVEPANLGLVGDESFHGFAQLRTAWSAPSLSRMPACALTISPSAQNGPLRRRGASAQGAR